MKQMAQEVYTVLSKRDDVKFYSMSGSAVAKLAIDFPCEDKYCLGCSDCKEDRMDFIDEYNKLTLKFRDDAINKLKSVLF